MATCLMSPPVRMTLLGLVSALLLAACASTPAQVPPPRSVVIFSGERIQADRDRMTEVDRWLRMQQEELSRLPELLIRTQSTTTPNYPWADFRIEGDTAVIYLQQIARDAEAPFRTYAHLHYLAERDELEEPWVSEENAGATGLQRELAILDRVADIWLLGRSVYDTQAFGPLDEILYAREGGFLREFTLVAQGDRFDEEREAHFEANPEREEEFVAWLERVFERSEPGYMGSPLTVEEEDPDDGDPGRR
jgi:hypothetical protein